MPATHLTAEIVRTACLAGFGQRYEQADGTIIRACPVSQVPAHLRAAGWRNVAMWDDAHDLKRLGLTVTRAQYVGGVRKTGRMIDVVALN